jgi:hypothetical protein
MNIHYTVMNAVRADGAKCIPAEGVEGAPPDFVIIQDSDYKDPAEGMTTAQRNAALLLEKETDEVLVSARLLQGFFEKFERGVRPEEMNPKDIEVRGSKTGSMTKDIIFDWGCRVIKNLPHDQGLNGKGVLLNLDFHGSRLNSKFQWFMLSKGGVFVNHGPSHTSTCGQPCDLGSNMCMHQAVATVAEDNARLSYESNSMYLNNRNVYEALCLLTDDQNDELRRTGRNAGVSGFEKAGLNPFSYAGAKWLEAQVQFGKLAKVLKQRGRGGAKSTAGRSVPRMG